MRLLRRFHCPQQRGCCYGGRVAGRNDIVDGYPSAPVDMRGGHRRIRGMRCRGFAAAV
ncbi:MAG: hypothetical protein ACYS76_10075 [Planctomycetota bacterium]